MRYLESRNGIYYYRRVVTVNGKKHTKRISLRTRDYLRAQKAALDLFFESESIEPMEGANRPGNSSRLTQSFHFFLFEPIF
ncbi:hypothetical protein, partial [Aeromonas veronii]|uniref:hypothetical protein n=1 Tax=Aeromonas veronii TaxID=654 RepID=UPI003D256F04